MLMTSNDIPSVANVESIVITSFSLAKLSTWVLPVEFLDPDEQPLKARANALAQSIILLVFMISFLFSESQYKRFHKRLQLIIFKNATNFHNILKKKALARKRSVCKNRMWLAIGSSQ